MPFCNEKFDAAPLPFLKWTGGKRWLAAEFQILKPRVFNRYYEPFLGGGAIYFSLRAWPATLSDINPDLVNVFQQVRDNVEEVIERLSAMRIRQSDYYQLRSQAPRLPITQAVRFLYLNRAAFNGIYRVNRRGRFNVPFGCKPGTELCDEKSLRAAALALSQRTIRCLDFEAAIDTAVPRDLIYADPPYTTQHDNNGFRRYNEALFSWEDQVRLAKSCKRAAERGVHVIVSNAAHGEVMKLYKGFDSRIVRRYTGISAAPLGRGEVQERLFYKIHH